MSLCEKITVNSHYTRSVNLERDADSPAIVNGYIPTARATDAVAHRGLDERRCGPACVVPGWTLWLGQVLVRCLPDLPTSSA